ncbi:MAG TPA: DUF4397 domain-containing protein [Aggregicoccus sp.]|nr:DUF4397 domain-containing protein [Aggregicoccus sp.]
MSLTRMLVLGLCVTLLGAGCDDDDDDGDGDGTPPAGSARLRVVHAAPDAPAVDIYAEGQSTPLFSNAAYTQTTAYREVPEGAYTLQVRPAGAAATSSPVYSVGPVTLTRDTQVTAVAAGLLGSQDPADGFRILVLQEGFTQPGASEVRARIVHAGADAPGVGIDVGDDGTVELASLARFADTGAQGVALPAGQALQVGLLTTGADAARVTGFTTPALPAGANLFLIATGRVEREGDAPDGFGLLAVGPEGTVGLLRQNPVVYVLHAGPDAPAVDVFSGTELVSGLAFGELSDGFQVPPDTYEVEVFPAQAGSERPAGDPAASASLTLEAGESYLVSAAGFLENVGGARQPLALHAFAADFANPEEGTARVRLVHQSPDVPAVDVGTVTGGQLDTPPAFANIAYPSASAPEGAALPATPLTVGVAPTGTRTPLATFDATPAPGLRVFAVAAGALDPQGSAEAFRVLLVLANPTPGLSPWQVGEALPTN